MMFNRTTAQSVFCTGLVVFLTASCGSDKKESTTVYAPVPTATQPVNEQTSQAPKQQGAASQQVSAENLAVDVQNSATLSNTPLLAGNALEVAFALRSPAPTGSAVSYRCNIVDDKQQSILVTGSQSCPSPFKTSLSKVGSFTFSVQAVSETGTMGAPITVPFSVVAAPVPNNQQVQNVPGASAAPQYVSFPVGQMYRATLPQGFHMVYRTSTWDQVGWLNLDMIDSDATPDLAAPHPISCANPRPGLSPNRAALQYCSVTPAINWNAPGNPFTNMFRFNEMGMMSYNSIALASDSSLQQVPIGGAMPYTEKLYVNVFSNISGQPSNAFAAQFSTEFSQTVSRLQIACGGPQNIQPLAVAPISQGFFFATATASPLFGCVTQRNNGYYVEIGAFPVEHQLPILPAQGWAAWSGQSFANVTAAEIVVEMGPYGVGPSAVGPAPMTVAPQAQQLMINTLSQLRPTVAACQPGMSINGCH